MKIRRLVSVGLLLTLLAAPIAWADDSSGQASGQDEGFWGLDWIQSVVSWVKSIVDDPDPTTQDVGLLDPTSTQEQYQSTPTDDSDRSGALDPQGSS